MGQKLAQVLMGLGAGLLLGLRWKFVVLYPVTLVVAVFVIGAGAKRWPDRSGDNSRSGRLRWRNGRAGTGQPAIV
jgi:hypothetical protein